MPKLTINGRPINRILSARVQIHNAGNERETGLEHVKPGSLIPLVQFVLQLPMDHDATLAKWALEPIGPKRFQMVVLTMQDRSGGDTKKWQFKYGYVYRYEEVEYPPQSGSSTDQGNYVELVIRGITENGMDYSGVNIVDVQSGQPEAGAGGTAAQGSAVGEASTPQQK